MVINSILARMIPDFKKAGLEKLKELLTSPKKIVITTHYKPDGDAIGSSLALYNYLVKKKHKVKVVAPSEYPAFLHWMKGNDKVLDFEQKKRTAGKVIAEADIIFCLDFNDIRRVEDMREPVEKSKAVKVMIDHHLEPVNFCDFNFSFPGSCATCELIYHFIVQSGDQKFLDQEIAACIYTGIMTDTGSFRFNSMSADTHRVIASLLDTGLNHSQIHEAVFDTYSESRTRFLGYILKDKMQILPAYNTGLIAVTNTELEQYHNETGDTEGIVNYPLNIHGIIMAAFFVERNGFVKISFRSKGDFSVKELAQKYFNGGGHRNAAGGKSDLSLDETVEKFISILGEYKEQLTE